MNLEIIAAMTYVTTIKESFLLRLSFILLINLGICTPTGHPDIQGAFLQFKQRVASSIAIVEEKPSATSLKLQILSFGDWFGIFILSILASYVASMLFFNFLVG